MKSILALLADRGFAGDLGGQTPRQRLPIGGQTRVAIQRGAIDGRGRLREGGTVGWIAEVDIDRPHLVRQRAGNGHALDRVTDVGRQRDGRTRYHDTGAERSD
jgi:hypothetical protein